jgi:cell division protein FtsQ
MQARLEKFVGVYSRTIAGLNLKVTYADLRYPNGFAVRRPVAAKAVAVKSAEIKPASDIKLNGTHILGTTKPSKPKLSPARSGNIITSKLSTVQT